MAIIEKQIELAGSKGRTKEKALFDSGASYSCIRKNIAEKLETILPLPEPLELHTAKEGESLKAMERVTLDFYLNGYRFSDEFIVIPGLSEDIVIGTLTLEKWHMKLDFKQREVIIDPEVTKLRLLKMGVEEIKEKREKYLIPAYLTYFTEPVHIVKGEMQYLYDDKGKKYLDAFSAVVTISVGHCHPDIIPEVQKQIAQLQHITTLYYTESLVRLAEKLAEIAPGNLQKSFFTNSGTEATEMAAIITKNYTKRYEFIALRHAFHGRTLMSMSLTGQSIWRHSTPYVFGVHHAPAAYCYRCPLGHTYPGCDIRCAYEIEEIIKYSTSGKIAGFIAEPIAGFGGVIHPPKEYFKIVSDIVHKYGGLLIIDEVQTGFGRTGEKWFGIEHWDVVPDIITMAKGMGNGIPIGGVITTAEIAESHRGLIHFSTYGGNPVSTTQARLVIETIEKRGYKQNAKVVGDYLKEKFFALQDKHKIIGDVRGLGLMLGIELVKDRNTKEPAAKEMLKLMDLCKDRGLFIGKGAMAGNVIRIKPPMCITKDDADFIVKVLDETLSIIEKEL